MTPEELRAEADRLTARAAELETQLTRADLATMTPEAIEQARRDGRLNQILNITKES